MKIRKLNIGLGRPKIILPIVAKTKEEVLSQGKELQSIPHDLVELRADWLDFCFNNEEMTSLLKDLREIIGDTPLLFTFRSKKEGGEKDITIESYTALIESAIASGYIDLVDVELFMGDDVLTETVAKAHEKKIKVVASSHDFEKTPSKEEILFRLKKMDTLGADIPKIAVMPRTKDDVLTLLSATAEMARHTNKPLITMSMGKLGMVSRIAGENFGSSMTFGSAAKASAPGQIPAAKLEEILNILHESME